MPFRKGQSGNPGGCSQARKLLNDSFLRALHRVWDKHGEKALERMAQEHPCQLVTLMFKLLPKETEAEVHEPYDFGSLSVTMDLIERVNEEIERKEQERREGVNRPLSLVKSE
jgi:hypothetical protein